MTPPPDPDHAVAIADALGALEVQWPAGHSWMGAAEPLPEVVRRLADREGVRRALVGSIGMRLYDAFFTQGRPCPVTAPSPEGGERTLSNGLAAANSSTGYLEAGWEVIAHDDGRWVVRRGGLRLWVTPEDVVCPDGPPAIGDVVALRHTGDAPALAPGFYIARGDCGFPTGLVDRVYLDLCREGAVAFIREATRRLNRTGLPFTAKVVDTPAGFDRRDAAVLYFARRDRERALETAEDLARALAPFLEGGTPAMTLPLSPGVAFAEDPGGEESFGAHRCLLIADAAVTAAERGLDDLDARLALVRDRFAEAGTSVEAPYLGPPSDGVPHPLALLDPGVRA
ncbi:MAG: T3SS effector HopA1 family protein [Thermoleophilia bacterium]